MKYRIFKQIVDLGSFTKAGEALNMTQSAISHAVSNLEREMGFLLFHRNKGTVQLTEDGRSVLNYIEALVSAEDHLNNQVHAMHHLEVGHIKVGSFASASTRLLPKIMKSFDERYPDVTVEYYDGRYDGIKEKLDNGSVDVAFLVDEFLEPSYDVLPYFKDELVAVFSKNAPEMRKRKSIEMVEIEKYPFIMPDNDQDTYLKAIFQTHQVMPQIKAKFNLMSSVFAMVEENLGMTVVAESALYKMDYALKTVSLKPRIYRNINLVTKKSQMKSPMIKAFFEIARQVGS